MVYVEQAYDVIGGNTDFNPVLLQDGVFVNMGLTSVVPPEE